MLQGYSVQEILAYFSTSVKVVLTTSTCKNSFLTESFLTAILELFYKRMVCKICAYSKQGDAKVGGRGESRERKLRINEVLF